MLLEIPLLSGRLFAKPCLESLRGIMRERAMAVDFEHFVHNQLHGLHPEREIDDGGHRGGHLPHEVGVREERVAQRGFTFGVFYSRRLDNVANFDIVGTSHLAAFAVETIFEGFVVEIRTFQPVAFAVGSGLFRPGIVGVDGRHWAIDRAYRAFYARFEIIVADVLLLEIHSVDRIHGLHI